jgi:hypothetical protein
MASRIVWSCTDAAITSSNLSRQRPSMYTFAALFTLKFSANMSPIPGLPVRIDIQILAYRVVPDLPVTKKYHTLHSELVRNMQIRYFLKYEGRVFETREDIR